MPLGHVSGAPALGDNPYVGAAASAGSAAVSLANALAAAHNQQLQLQAQQQRQKNEQLVKENADYVRLLGEGAIPQDTNVDRPTLMQDPSQRYGGRDPERFITLPTLGKSLYIPTRAEKEAAKENDSNSWVTQGALGEALEKGLGVKQGTRIELSQMPSLLKSLEAAQPAAPADEPQDIDTTHFSEPVQIGRRSGKVAKLQLPDGVSLNAPKEKEYEPHFETSTDKKGNVHVIGMDAKSGKVLFENTLPGVGKPSDTDERFRERQQDRQDAREARTQERADKVADAAKTRHDKLQSQEQDQWNLQAAYGDLADASKHKDGEFVPEPKYNANTGEISMGQDVQLTPQRRKAYAALAQQAKSKAQGFAKQSADIRKKFGWGEFGQQPAAATPAPAAAAAAPAATPRRSGPPSANQPAQKKAAAGKVKASDVVAWAKANGKDPKDALARAKRRGVLAGGE